MPARSRIRKACHRWLLWWLWVGVLTPVAAFAQAELITGEVDAGYIARIELHTTAELEVALQRAQELFDSGKIPVGAGQPIIFVLHGAEARALLKSRYQQHRTLADQAARLSALQVVDIKVCRSWLGEQSLDASQLLPFVGTVADGPEEIQRLLQQKQYVYF